MRAKYFRWLLGKVELRSDTRYSILCEQLFHTEFRWDLTIDLDADRAENGMALRIIYHEETGLHANMNGEPCNILEMLVALSIAMEEIMGDVDDCHPGRWFAEMIYNLDLADMTDDNYTPNVVINNVGNWMSRNYDKNGRGGLFPLRSRCKDQRKAPIWEQAGNYLSEKF